MAVGYIMLIQYPIIVARTYAGRFLGNDCLYFKNESSPKLMYFPSSQGLFFPCQMRLHISLNQSKSFMIQQGKKSAIGEQLDLVKKKNSRYPFQLLILTLISRFFFVFQGFFLF